MVTYYREHFFEVRGGILLEKNPRVKRKKLGRKEIGKKSIKNKARRTFNDSP